MAAAIWHSLPQSARRHCPQGGARRSEAAAAGDENPRSDGVPGQASRLSLSTSPSPRSSALILTLALTLALALALALALILALALALTLALALALALTLTLVLAARGQVNIMSGS